MPGTALFFAMTILTQTARTSSLQEGDEAVVYTYRAEMDRKGEISSPPVASSFAAFVDYQKATHAEDLRLCQEMERRGDVFWVESGTRCQVLRGGGMSVGPIVRAAQEIRLLNGPHKGQVGWILADHLRRRSRIKVEPPRRYTDANWDTPRPLALAFQAQDKAIYRELFAARANLTAAAKARSQGDRQHRVLRRAYLREHRVVLDRYDLDEATALRILDWGKQGDWPTQDPKDAAMAGS